MKKVGAAIVIGVAALAAATSISAASPAKSTAMGQKNIVQTAVAAGQFKTLVALVKQAGLAGALSGPGPLTVFAPTDAAFAKVPKATLAALAQGQGAAEGRPALPRRQGQGDCRTGLHAHVGEDARRCHAPDPGVRHQGLRRRRPGDRRPTSMASNGVIHVINKVLIPPKQ